jgi:tetratricopeptide (TPR) repeat protein/O-antigen ligase
MRRTASRRGRTDALTNQTDIASSKLRLLGVALLCAKVALVPLVFDQAFDWPFVVSKALLSHALAYALAGVIAGLLIRFGRSFVVWSWLHIPVLAFLLVSAAATAFAVDPLLALYGTHARMLGLGTIADWVLLYAALVLLVRSRADVVAVLGSAIGASILVLAYELVQLAGRDPFRWNMDSAARPFSTIGQPTSLAQYLATLAFGAAAFALLVRGLGRRVRVALLVYSAVLLAATAANGTRSALLGIATGSTLLVLLIWMTYSGRRALLVGVLGVSLAVAAITLIFVPTLIGSRIASTIEQLQSDDASVDLADRLEPYGSDRFALYQIATGIVRERPLLGYGPDSFAAGVPEHRPERAHPTIQQGVPTSGHSWIVYIATSSGLLGLAIFIAIVVVALVLTVRRGIGTVAVAGAAMIASFLGTGLTTVNEISTEWLLWSGIGMIAASTASPFPFGATSAQATSARVTRQTRQTARSSSRSIAAAACVAAGLLLTLSLIGPAAASRSAHASQDARLVGRASQAIELGLATTRTDPLRADYWRILGLAYVATARWRDANAAFDRALKLAPYDVRNVNDLALTYLILGNAGDAAARTKAVQLGDQAAATDPNNPSAHLTRAAMRQGVGDHAESLRSVERALEIDPRSTNARLYVIGAQTLLALGRPADAVRLSRQGTTILSTTPPSFDLRLELVRGLMALGQRGEALSEIEIALTIRPTDRTAQQLRSEIIASSGR